MSSNMTCVSGKAPESLCSVKTLNALVGISYNTCSSVWQWQKKKNMRKSTNVETTELARHGRALQMPKTPYTEQLLCLILYIPIVAMVMEEMRLQRKHVLSIPWRRFIREGGKMSQLLPPPSPQILQALESHSGFQTASTLTLKKFQVSVSDIPKVSLGHFKVFFF